MTWWYTDNVGTDPVSGAIVKVVFPPNATFLEARLDWGAFVSGPNVTYQPSGATEVVVSLPTIQLPFKRQTTAMKWTVNSTCTIASPIVINGTWCMQKGKHKAVWTVPRSASHAVDVIVIIIVATFTTRDTLSECH